MITDKKATHTLVLSYKKLNIALMSGWVINSKKDSTEGQLFFSNLIAFWPNHRAGGLACDSHDVSNYELLHLPWHKNEHTAHGCIINIIIIISSALWFCHWWGSISLKYSSITRTWANNEKVNTTAALLWTLRESFEQNKCSHRFLSKDLTKQKHENTTDFLLAC